MSRDNNQPSFNKSTVVSQLTGNGEAAMAMPWPRGRFRQALTLRKECGRQHCRPDMHHHPNFFANDLISLREILWQPT